jgi:hypothetical protein
MEQQTAIDTHNLLAMVEQESNTRGPKVTIYFSVPHSSNYAIIGRAELKGHIHAVAACLEEMGVAVEDRKHIVDALHTLPNADELWKHRSESYAIFASPSILRWYALPLPVKDEVHVGDDFHITPLIQLISLPEHYYLLEVSFGTPRMARVHPQFVTPISLDQVWALEASWDHEDVVHDRAFHTSGSARRGHHGTIPNGGSQDGEFRRRERFLKLLAGAVNDVLKHSLSPLVITGADDLVAHFYKHLHYSNIIISPEQISIPEGSPMALDTATWRACTNVYSDRAAQPSVADAQLEYLRCEGRVTEDIDTIVSLSEAGGIMTLLINEPAINSSNSNVSEPDLINAALVRTLQHHGNVLATNTHVLPTGVIALLRTGRTIA